MIALYDDFDDARDAIHELLDAGYSRDRISLVARDVDERYAEELEGIDEDNTGEAIAGGATVGGVLGGIAGVLVGLDAVAIPGIGPVLAVGPIVGGVIGVGAGAATGGLVGGLTEAGVDEDEAHTYAEGVRRGGTLVAVQAENEAADAAADILDDHNPVDVDERETRWREDGWERHDSTDEPYTTSEIERERTRNAVVTRG
ncbi:MAG: general stress protein [Thermomicrobiales bacterium]